MRKDGTMAQSRETSQDARLRDLEFYASLKDYEQHFNGLEFEVRKIASVWILAIFSAIAVIVRGDTEFVSGLLGVSPLLCLIALFGNIGLLTLWFLDQRVYHQLLSAAFTMGLRLERRYSEIPPLRHQMWKNSGMRGMARFQALFYAVPMAVNALAGLFAAALAISAQTRLGWLMMLVAAIAAAIPLWVVVQTRLFRGGRPPAGLAGAEGPTTEDFKGVEAAIERWANRP